MGNPLPEAIKGLWSVFIGLVPDLQSPCSLFRNADLQKCRQPTAQPPSIYTARV